MFSNPCSHTCWISLGIGFGVIFPTPTLQTDKHTLLLFPIDSPSAKPTHSFLSQIGQVLLLVFQSMFANILDRFVFQSLFANILDRFGHRFRCRFSDPYPSSQHTHQTGPAEYAVALYNFRLPSPSFSAVALHDLPAPVLVGLTGLD